MAKKEARHVGGWAATSAKQLPGPRHTTPHFLTHYLPHTFWHTTAPAGYCMRACENPPAFLSANCLQLSKWRGGKSSGGNQMWARATKMCKEIFPSKMLKYKKKLCHILALNHLSFLGVTIILCWLKEGGIGYGGMIGWTSLGLSITSPRVSPELLQTHFFLQYDQ